MNAKTNVHDKDKLPSRGNILVYDRDNLQATLSSLIMIPDVICISSSPPQIFARSPTPVFYESPGVPPRKRPLPPSIPSPPSLFETPSVSRLSRPRKSQPVAATGKLADDLSDNGSVLSGEIGRENLPLSSAGRTKTTGKKVEAAKSSNPIPMKRVTKSPISDSSQSVASKKGPAEKKLRARKSKAADKLPNQTLKGRVTKPKTGETQKVAQKPVRNSQTPVPEDPAKGTGHSVSWEPGCLQLDEATSRKPEWTPPKTSTTPFVNLDDDDDDIPSDTEGSPRSTNRSFGELFSTYGFNKQPQALRDSCQHTNGGGPTKKRRIELVDNAIFGSRLHPQNSTTSSLEDNPSKEATLRPAEKGKRTQKRKLTTITAHATAKYMPDDSEQESAILQYFPTEDHKAAEDGPGKCASKQSNSKSRPSRKKCQGPKGKNASPDFEILPPEKAFKTFADQNLLFGTSSQLERDESPTFTRETQVALKNSESFERQTSLVGPEFSQGNVSSFTSSSISSSVTSRLASSRNLWSVAARDFDGSLVQADIIDLADTPKANETLANIKPLPNPNEGWLDIDSIPDTPSKDANNLLNDKLACPKEKTPTAEITSNEKEANQPTALPSKNTKKATLPERPAFGGYSTEELAKKVKRYGFKAIKSRDRMISLLEKCWESENPDASTIASPSCDATTSTTEKAAPSTSKDEGRSQDIEKPQPPSKAKRGRPAKKATDRDTAQGKKKPEVLSSRSTHKDAPVEDNDVVNSTGELVPSSVQRNPIESRKSVRHAPSNSSDSKSSRASTKGPRTKVSTTAPSNPINVPDISLQIKSAIHSQPPISSLSGRKQPTWFEKILMYDPIVLEDLATWLNTEGLGRIGEDREVSAGSVREWCESEGICCCWKKGLDGGAGRGSW